MSQDPKTPISLTKAQWDIILWRLREQHNKEDHKEIVAIIETKMSRSSNKPSEEAAVLSPLDFAGAEGKTFCVSSKEREPIDQLLPALSGNILVFTSWEPNESGISSSAEKGEKKDVTLIKIHSVAQVQIILKRPGFDTLFNHVVIDRIDEIDNKKNKKDKAAQILGMLGELPAMLKKRNLFVTTMMGINVLYDNVDKHVVV